MHQHLFNHIDIKPENINVPDGTVAINEESILHWLWNEHKKVGGLDFQLLE
jgi:glucosamine-6-phosphate deaminase